LGEYYYQEDKNDAFYRVDLAVERRRADISANGVKYRICESDGGTWECLEITDEEGAKDIGRPVGIYDTLNTGRMDLLSELEILDAEEEIARKLCELFDKMEICPERLLVVGLGNARLTPDAIGPRAAEWVKPTMHVREFDEETFNALECSEIAVICPGVSAYSGLEAAEVVKGLARRILPDAIIAIDSYAAREPKRLGSVIQISNTGIFPGSGIGARHAPLSESTLSSPVIAIGVPTVIDSRLFLAADRGGRLQSDTEPMLVSPREIDEIADVGARIIGEGINQAFGISPY